MNATISCPACGNPVLISTDMLLAGHQFSCSRCNGKISLHTESVSKTQKALSEMRELKSLRNEEKSTRVSAKNVTSLNSTKIYTKKSRFSQSNNH